jgi:hypothetical protein
MIDPKLISHDGLLDGDYLFVDLDSGPFQLRRLLIASDVESFDLFYWKNNWVYDDNVSRETAAQMLGQAWDVYQRVIT